MWLPLTIRTRLTVLARTTDCNTSPTHGPAAFTRVRARIVRSLPVRSSDRCSTQWSLSRSAPVQRVQVATVAPRSAASRAFSTTMRASSTQQSEYSKPSVYSGFNGSPAGSWRRRRVRVFGRRLRPPRWSYRNSPSRSSQAGLNPR